jgi:hypothetical protein
MSKSWRRVGQSFAGKVNEAMMSRSALMAGFLIVAGCSSSPNKTVVVQPVDSEVVRKSLDDLAAGYGDWSNFSISYTDLHGLHGGLTHTIDGHGKVEQKAVRTPVGEVRQVAKPDLERLVSLLQEVRAWEQRTPERDPVPDESRSHLTVRCGAGETTIWEWYNDIDENKRISRVKSLMTEIAWTRASMN